MTTGRREQSAMWARNLLFAGLCMAGLVALGATLFATGESADHAKRQSVRRDAEFQSVVNRIDTAFRSEWEQAELQPAGPAEDLLVARRLSLALTGTIPSLEEIRRMESRAEGDRVAWHLEGLLADRRYADYMAERLARPLVGVEDGPFLLYRRRRFVTWLADELHQNRRYDQIVRELIAGEGLWTDNPATNFITVSVKPNEDNEPDAEKLAGRVSRAFLGVRLDCAQCHDHPFNDWKQSDFQSLAAFFGEVKPSFTGLRDADRPYEYEDVTTGKPVEVAPDVPFCEESLPDNGTSRQRLAQWVIAANNRAFARATVNRVWALMFGRPLVEPVDNVPPEGPHPAALTILADDFATHQYDLRRLIRLIAATEVFRLDSAAEHEITLAHEHVWAAFPIRRLRSEQVVGGILQSASLTTIDHESHIIVQLAKSAGQNDFVRRYGDAGEAELESRGGTIPQRLLLLNGNLVHDKIDDNIFANAATRIAALSPDDATAVETAYLAVLSRRPSPEEAAHFEARLTEPGNRNQQLADLYWTLINSTEFSWNH